jgi:hypothetical protein
LEYSFSSIMRSIPLESSDDKADPTGYFALWRAVICRALCDAGLSILRGAQLEKHAALGTRYISREDYILALQAANFSSPTPHAFPSSVISPACGAPQARTHGHERCRSQAQDRLPAASSPTAESPRMTAATPPAFMTGKTVRVKLKTARKRAAKAAHPCEQNEKHG